MSKGKLFLLIIIPLLIIIVVASVFIFIYFQEELPFPTRPLGGMKEQKSVIEDTTTIKVFYPAGLSLHMREVKIKRVFAPLKIAEAALNELFSPEHYIDTGVIPEDTRLIALYWGIDNILYVDMSKGFQRNFHGDIVDEYILLRSIYDTVLSNVEADDVKILIQSEEAETLGGHFYIKHTLKESMTQGMSIEERTINIE